MDNSVVLTPLGGLGEFGMNMMLVESGGEMVVLDAGMMFPEPNMLGVDFVLPDITYLLANREKVRGIVLTHGHEDHIGGLADVLSELDVPVYGTKLTLALASNRLQEYGVLSKARLIEIDAESRLDFGRLSCEFAQVAHSIPGALSVALRTPAGLIFHTSDFKLDHTPIGSESVDVGKLASYGNEGVLLLLSDSTNAEVPGYTPSERSITSNLERLFQKARGRLIVSTFASNLYRVQQFVDLATQFNRWIAVTGRNMVNNVKVASELGYLRVPPNRLVDVRDVDRLPPDEVVILTTGSQGEPLSALSLMATDSHARLRIEKGDTVVISARLIPGHEREIGILVNHLYRRGADVRYGGAEGIHVSGHGSQEDLKTMLRLIRPKFFVPLHGEYRQLTLHARIAEEVGVPSANVRIVEDGEQIRLTPDACEVIGKVPAGRVLVDGKILDGVEEVVLRDRRQLSEDGIVIVVLVMSLQSGQIIGGPDFVSRGFVHVDESEDLLSEAKERVNEAIRSLNAEERAEQDTVQEAARLALRRFFTKRTDRRPLILPVIIEV
jgi:ribonuclease J